MRLTKIALGICILLLAAVIARSTKAKSNTNTVWYYEEPGTRKAVILDFVCPPNLQGGCYGPIGSPSLGKQLYQNKECNIPLGYNH